MLKRIKLIDWLKSNFFSLRESVDLPFLFFLILLLNVSLGVKLLGLIFIYTVRPNFKFYFLKGRIPLFYAAIIVLSVFQMLLHYGQEFNYYVLALLGCSFWIASLLVTHQLKLAIEREGIEKVEKALNYFFVLNALLSAFDLFKIMYEIQNINPYSYDGFNYRYSASTGDYIKGIMFDISTANMIINSFGIFYFLYQRKYLLSFLCQVVAMYTTSNLGNFILFFFFVWIFIFDSSKFHKSIILCYITFIFIFIIQISPSNLNYLNVKVKELFHLENKIIETNWHDRTEKDKLIYSYVSKNHKQIIAKQLSRENLGSLIIEKEQQERKKTLIDDSTAVDERNKSRNHFVLFYKELYGDTFGLLYKKYYNKYPGKYLSFVETVNYSKRNISNFLIGSGAANFSSKLAYKATNMGFSGRYLQKYKYIAPEFKKNHLKISLSYYVQSPDEHSIINFPNSVFNQLLGEYGVIGILLFFIFYVWFYLKRFKILTYGKILLPMCLIFLLTDYWFEALSIVIIFEIMMYIDIAKRTPQNTAK